MSIDHGEAATEELPNQMLERFDNLPRPFHPGGAIVPRETRRLHVHLILCPRSPTAANQLVATCYATERSAPPVDGVPNHGSKQLRSDTSALPPARQVARCKEDSVLCGTLRQCSDDITRKQNLCATFAGRETNKDVDSGLKSGVVRHLRSQGPNLNRTTLRSSSHPLAFKPQQTKPVLLVAASPVRGGSLSHEARRPWQTQSRFDKLRLGDSTLTLGIHFTNRKVPLKKGQLPSIFRDSARSHHHPGACQSGNGAPPMSRQSPKYPCRAKLLPASVQRFRQIFRATRGNRWTGQG